MDLVQEFKRINDEYNNRLFKVFILAIDTAIAYSIEEKMNPLDRYVYVNNVIEDAYRKLAFAKGNIDNPSLPYEVTPPIDDVLMEKIYNYVEPLFVEARNEIQKQYQEIMKAETLGELLEKFEAFKEMLRIKDVPNVLYEDLEIKKRV